MIRTIIAIVALGLALAARGGEACFSYAQPGAADDVVGTGKAQAYDVAIKLDGATFAGSKVKSMSVPLSSSANITDVKVWLTKKLSLSSSVNAPDIMSASAKSVDGMLTYTLAEPVTIGADGLFVGYSFNVFVADKDTEEPVQVVKGTEYTGLYLHGGTTWRSWTQVARTLKVVSKMTVTLEGDYADNDIRLGIAEDDITADLRKDRLTIPVSISNMGSFGPKDLELSYAFNGGAATTMNLKVEAPKSLYGQNVQFDLPVTNEARQGDNTLAIRIEKVNGQADINEQKAISLSMYGVTEYPVNRPLMEEYTGLWCSWCPRGFAALEYMSRMYPEQWIGVAWHGDDDMSIMRSAYFPTNVSTYPNATLNRGALIDPYWGAGEDGSTTIEDDWLAARAEFTPIAVDVVACRLAANPSNIMAQAAVRPVRPLKGDYRLLYYLVSDGLSNEDWVQLNQYAGSNPNNYAFPEMKQFCQGKAYMHGLVFNDIISMTSDVKGIAGSLPGELAVNSIYTHEYEFATAGVVNLKGYDLIGTAKSLHVVAAVVDYSTGRVVNSAKCTVSNIDGVADAVGEATVLSCEYYDLQGRPADANTRGLKIVRSVMSDGSVRVGKVAGL